MATGRNDHAWRTNGLIRRDFRQDHGSGPEEIKRHPKRKSGLWCKKEGRQHRWERFSYMKYKNYKGETVENYKWRCQGCGKIEWNLPRIPIPSHKHDYRGTRIENNWWDDQEVIYEYCIICNKRGRSYRY